MPEHKKIKEDCVYYKNSRYHCWLISAGKHCKGTKRTCSWSAGKEKLYESSRPSIAWQIKLETNHVINVIEENLNEMERKHNLFDDLYLIKLNVDCWLRELNRGGFITTFKDCIVELKENNDIRISFDVRTPAMHSIRLRMPFVKLEFFIKR